MEQQNSFEISFEGSLEVVQQVAEWLSTPKQSDADESRWNTWTIGEEGYRIYKSDSANNRGKYSWKLSAPYGGPDDENEIFAFTEQLRAIFPTVDYEVIARSDIFSGDEFCAYDIKETCKAGKVTIIDELENTARSVEEHVSLFDEIAHHLEMSGAGEMLGVIGGDLDDIEDALESKETEQSEFLLKRFRKYRYASDEDYGMELFDVVYEYTFEEDESLPDEISSLLDDGGDLYESYYDVEDSGESVTLEAINGIFDEKVRQLEALSASNEEAKGLCERLSCAIARERSLYRI